MWRVSPLTLRDDCWCPPDWASGAIQQIVRNMQFNMTVAWSVFPIRCAPGPAGSVSEHSPLFRRCRRVGTNIKLVVDERMAARKPILFYFFQPSEFINESVRLSFSGFGAILHGLMRVCCDGQFTRVALKQYSRECWFNNTYSPQGYGSGQCKLCCCLALAPRCHWLFNAVNCDYPAYATRKYYNAAFGAQETYRDVVSELLFSVVALRGLPDGVLPSQIGFVKQFQLYNQDVVWMLQQWSAAEAGAPVANVLPLLATGFSSASSLQDLSTLRIRPPVETVAMSRPSGSSGSSDSSGRRGCCGGSAIGT